jgi:hypothetical protein
MALRGAQGNENRIALQFIDLDENIAPAFYTDSATILVDFESEETFTLETGFANVFGTVLCASKDKRTIEFSRFSGPWVDLLDSSTRNLPSLYTQNVTLTVSNQKTGESAEVSASVYTATDSDNLAVSPLPDLVTHAYVGQFMRLRMNKEVFKEGNGIEFQDQNSAPDLGKILITHSTDLKITLLDEKQNELEKSEFLSFLFTHEGGAASVNKIKTLDFYDC